MHITFLLLFSKRVDNRFLVPLAYSFRVFFFRFCLFFCDIFHLAPVISPCDKDTMKEIHGKYLHINLTRMEKKKEHNSNTLHF